MATTVVEQIDPSDARATLIALGLNTPARRFLAGTSAAGIILYAMKQPSGAFKDGRVRQWSLVSSELDAIPVHFLVYPTIVGLALATFL